MAGLVDLIQAVVASAGWERCALVPLLVTGTGRCPVMMVPQLGSRPDLELAAECGEPVGHVPQARAHRSAVGVVAAPVVGHSEPQGSVLRLKTDPGLRGMSVVGGVLQRFQAAEIHRRLGVLAEAPDPLGFNRHRQRRLAGLGVERRGQAEVGQQRRVDPAGEVTQVFQRTGGVCFELAEDRPGLGRIRSDGSLGQPEFDGQGDQVLLGPVVDVAFQPPPRLVLRGDQPLPGCPQVLNQPGVGQRQARPAEATSRKSSPSCSRAADPGPRTPAPARRPSARSTPPQYSQPPTGPSRPSSSSPTYRPAADRRYGRPGQRPLPIRQIEPWSSPPPPAPVALPCIVTCSVARPATVGKEATCLGRLVPASPPPGKSILVRQRYASVRLM